MGGNVLSFYIKGDKKTAFNFINNLKMIDICNNLGDTKSLVVHPATTTHRILTDEERKDQNIFDNLVRLSIGLEDFEDIKNDLEQALIEINYSFSDFLKNNTEISPLTCLMKTAITIQTRKYSP